MREGVQPGSRTGPQPVGVACPGPAAVQAARACGNHWPLVKNGLGRNGIERIVDITLTDDERQALHTSAEAVPLVMIIFSVASITTGSFLGFEKSLAPAGFIYFFLFVSLSRLFNWTLRSSSRTW